MRDAHSIPLIAGLHPKVRQDFQSFIEDCEQDFDITLRIVQGFRSFAQEDALYAQGRTTPGPVVTDSKGGMSYHNYGLAIDIVPIVGNKEDWNANEMRFANIGAQYNITWGGNWNGNLKDYDHFENKCGLNWRDLLNKYNNKEFIEGTNFVVI